MTAPIEPPDKRQYQLVSVPPSARILRGVSRVDIGATPSTVQVSHGAPQMFVLRLRGYHESRVVIQFGDPNPVRVELRPESSVGMATDPPSMGVPAAPMRRIVLGPPDMRPMARIVRVTPPDGAMRAAPRVMRRVTEQGIVDPFRK